MHRFESLLACCAHQVVFTNLQQTVRPGTQTIFSPRWLTHQDTHCACARRQQFGRLAIMQTGKECGMSAFELRTMFWKQEFVPL